LTLPADPTPPIRTQWEHQRRKNTEFIVIIVIFVMDHNISGLRMAMKISHRHVRAGHRHNLQAAGSGMLD